MKSKQKINPASLIIRNITFLVILFITGAVLVTSHMKSLGLSGFQSYTMLVLIICIFSFVSIMTLFLELRKFVYTIASELRRPKPQDTAKADDGGAIPAHLATHQLRAPVVAVQSVLKTLMSDVPLDDAVRKELLAQAFERSEDMLALVNGLLDLSEARHEQAGGATCNPAAVLMSVTTALAPIASGRNIKIKTDMKKAPQSAGVSEKQLGHIFTNLIENAIKYSGGGGEVGVSLSDAETGSSWLRFSVTDSGIGIPEDAREKLFTEFYRADNARSVVSQGTGLGLALVKNIVDKHGGTISFESKQNEGTTFTVLLPL